MRVAQIDRAGGLAEHDGRRHEHRRSALIVSVGWPFRERTTGRLDEALELGVGDGVGIHPEAPDRDLVCRGFFRIVAVRSHEEGAIGDPDHAGARGSVHEAMMECPAVIAHRANGQRPLPFGAMRQALTRPSCLPGAPSWPTARRMASHLQDIVADAASSGFFLQQGAEDDAWRRVRCVRRQRGPVVAGCVTGRQHARDRPATYYFSMTCARCA